MPNRITNDKIQNFLARNTIPLSLSILPPSLIACPICSTPYSEQDPSYVHPLIPPDGPEYPIQVIKCGGCNHIIGRRCIEKSVRAGQPWSHTCPICREEWFVPPHSTRREILGSVRRCLNLLARIPRVRMETRGDMEEVERTLTGVEIMLMERRWI